MTGMAMQDLVSANLLDREIGRAVTSPEEADRLPFHRRQALIKGTLVRQVIPYLTTLNPSQTVRSAISPDTVALLATHLIRDRQLEARAEILRLQGMGIDSDRLFLDLLAPAARLLGQRWMEDACSFVDVTIGVNWLQRMLRELSAGPNRRNPGFRHERRIILATLPDEQHTFGLSILGEFFLRAGWEVRTVPRVAAADLVGLLDGYWFDVIGLSAGSEVRLPAVAAVVRTLRPVSRNPNIRVLVGGAAFQDPDSIAFVGADATAGDARTAVREAECLRVNH